MRFRTATRADVPQVLTLLADDDVARSRSHPTSQEPDARTWAAFEAIDADPRNELIVVEADDGTVVGTCQLTYVSSLSRGGVERVILEAVRVRADQRGLGTGRALMLWSLARARDRGCGLAQLTPDVRRTDAHRFYERLGFTASHVGMKRALPHRGDLD